MTYDFDFAVLDGTNLRALADGMLLTLQITATAIVVGIAWGTVIALMRQSPYRALRIFASLYVTLFRSIPLVIVLLWFFLVVPQALQALFQLNSSTDLRVMSALVAFSLFEAAYFSEIVRAGLRSVPAGQWSAARALGMNAWTAYRYVVLPQAFRNMAPVFMTQGIVLFQDTSLVYVSSLADFFGRATGIGERDHRMVEMLFIAGATYFFLCFGASWLARTFQTRNRNARSRAEVMPVSKLSR